MTRKNLFKTTPLSVLALFLLLTAVPLYADVKLPTIFGDHMVLQREKPVVVWGTADPGETVTVRISRLKGTVKANPRGQWCIQLGVLPAGGPHTLTVKGKNMVTYQDVLMGEVWVCSGQSNMGFSVNSANDADLELLNASYPNLRLISVPQVANQTPQSEFKGQWEASTPDVARNFSAVGFFYGRLLHQALDVPVGLIDNAWGGSAAEAWVRRDILEADELLKPLMARWKKTEATYDFEALKATYQTKLAQWQTRAQQAKREGKPQPGKPRAPRNALTGNQRPANLYGGVLHPVIGYGIRGAIWYQGESNASRAYQYRYLFPLMIQNWRDDWQQGDFPFYWVQLADFRDEKIDPAESDWAELREAQTMTMSKLANTGEAVITDLGEAHDIHPRNKLDVARRLARWALAKDYGQKLVYRSPIYKSCYIEGKRMIVSFDHVGGGLDTFDVRQPVGFAIAGPDKKFVWAQAKITGKDTIEVWSDQIAEPVSVRYAWADNPVCNVQNREHLPLTPFRTDTWAGVTVDKH
jgi:sialate O-acetylesterase